MMLKLSSAVAVAALMVLPAVSHAQYAPGYHYNSGYYGDGYYGGGGYQSNDYDGYCYMRRHNAGTTGAVVGALAGGAIGGTFANTHNKGVGTALGAIVGGVAGNAIGRSSVNCYNGDYYSYQDGYYQPGPAPDGYEAVYFHDRPDHAYYEHVYTSRVPKYGYGTAYGGDPYEGGDAFVSGHDDGYYNNSYDDDDGYAGQDDGDYSQPCDSSCGYSVTYSQPYTVYDGSSGYYGTTGGTYGYAGQSAPGSCSCAQWSGDQPYTSGWHDDHGGWHDGGMHTRRWRDSNGVWHVSRRSSYSYSSSSYGY